MGAGKEAGKLGIFPPSGFLYKMKTDERQEMYQMLNKIKNASIKKK